MKLAKRLEVSVYTSVSVSASENDPTDGDGPSGVM